jgi:hypothetical protein
VEDDVPIDSETLLMTDFVNLKIKTAQSFGDAHRGRMCVHVFIWVSARMYMNIYVCTVFLKNNILPAKSIKGQSFMNGLSTLQ